MKLVIAIVSNDDSHALSNALNKEKLYGDSFIDHWGFSKNGKYHLVDWYRRQRMLNVVLDLVKEYSKQRTELVPSTAAYDIGRFASFPVEVTVGGATVFVVDVEQFIKV